MTIHRGAVAEFDEHRGLGAVESSDGRRLLFHCTAIADGSRSITVGAKVVFQVAAGHGGHWEATSVTKLA
ncbi:MAG TPA: cold shock domain-containing protein [Acidimicrobiales bacterium]|nr:cold shock domain-containing protein [Acidimicrobiales bacterium]